MIAELIPALTAEAIHLRMLKEILCGYHDPRVKADQVWACLVFRKVAVAKPSATAALCDDLMCFHSDTANCFDTPSPRCFYDKWELVKLISGETMISQLLLMIFDFGLLSRECGY